MLLDELEEEDDDDEEQEGEVVEDEDVEFNNDLLAAVAATKWLNLPSLNISHKLLLSSLLFVFFNSFG